MTALVHRSHDACPHGEEFVFDDMRHHQADPHGAADLAGMTRRVLHVALLAALLACCGCASVGQYFARRGADAADILRLKGMAGLGIDAKVEVTHFLSLGGGIYYAAAIGIDTRRAGGWEEVVVDFGIPGNTLRRQTGYDGGPAVHTYEFALGSLIFGLPGDPYVTNETGFAEWLNLRAIAFLFLGADVELRGGELLDFFAGIVGADPSGDDG
jgi:hypothetical protein